MQKFLHNLMMTSVFYHILVGCCWHHAHTEPLGECGSDQAVGACVGHSHDHPEHDEGQESPLERPPGQDSHCDGEQCCFVVPKPGGGARLADRTSSVDVVCRDATSLVQPPVGYLLNEGAPAAGIPTLRSHLMNQVFLI